jgi:hypothetical protein
MEDTEDGRGFGLLAFTRRDHPNVHEANLDGRARLRPNRDFPAIPRTKREPRQRTAVGGIATPFKPVSHGGWGKKEDTEGFGGAG